MSKAMLKWKSARCSNVQVGKCARCGNVAGVADVACADGQMWQMGTCGNVADGQMWQCVRCGSAANVELSL